MDGGKSNSPYTERYGKGNAVVNYSQIACLNLLWKLLTGIITENIYDHLNSQRVLPEKQKGYMKGTRGTKDQS